MNKISNIVTYINNGLKAHNIKDINFNGVCELIEKNDKIYACEYVGGGEYQQAIEENRLNIYHRIVGEVVNEEDLEGGFGRNSWTTLTYPMLMVVYGYQRENIKDDSYNLALEFKKLIPRNANITDINRISITNIDLNKQDLAEQESLTLRTDNILFGINYNVVIKTTENCNTLDCV